MASDEDWILRPVVRELCRYESLIDGTLDMGDIRRLNDLLDVCDENERRQMRALEKK